MEKCKCICGESKDNPLNLDTCRYCNQTFLTTHEVCFDEHLQEHIIVNRCAECKSTIHNSSNRCREKDCTAVLHEQCVPYHLFHTHVGTCTCTRESTHVEVEEEEKSILTRIEDLERSMDRLYDVFEYEIWSAK